MSFYIGILVAVSLVKFKISSYIKVLVVGLPELIFSISFHLEDFVIHLRIFTGKAHFNKTKAKAITKSMNMRIGETGTSNQLFIRGSYTEIKFL